MIYFLIHNEFFLDETGQDVANKAKSVLHDMIEPGTFNVINEWALEMNGAEFGEVDLYFTFAVMEYDEIDVVPTLRTNGIRVKASYSWDNEDDCPQDLEDLYALWDAEGEALKVWEANYEAERLNYEAGLDNTPF